VSPPLIPTGIAKNWEPRVSLKNPLISRLCAAAWRACKSRTLFPRAEVRVRLRVHIKIAGVDAQGKNIEEKAYTENVNLSGFLCSCVAPLRMDSVVETYLMEPREQLVGKARAVRSESSVPPSTRYGFRFVEKTGPWVLD
jgi:hypothetical protein